MAFLRSCYSTEARFFNDVTRQDPIIWYWAQPDAPYFLGRSQFAPLTFSDDRLPPNTGVGEQSSASRPWRDGSIPMAPPTGVLDGNQEWFYRGQSVTDPGLSRTAFGIPADCVDAFIPCGPGGVLTQTYWDVYNAVHVHVGKFVTAPPSTFSDYVGLGFITLTMICTTVDQPGFHYVGMVIFGDTSEDVPLVYYVFDQIGPEPTLLMRSVPGFFDLGDYTLVIRGGP